MTKIEPESLRLAIREDLFDSECLTDDPFERASKVFAVASRRLLLHGSADEVTHVCLEWWSSRGPTIADQCYGHHAMDTHGSLRGALESAIRAEAGRINQQRLQWGGGS